MENIKERAYKLLKYELMYPYENKRPPHIGCGLFLLDLPNKKKALVQHEDGEKKTIGVLDAVKILVYDRGPENDFFGLSNDELKFLGFEWMFE